MKYLAIVSFVLVAGLPTLSGRVDLLLVPPPEPVSATSEIVLTLYLNNPTAQNETITLPAEITADYASSVGHHHVELTVIDAPDKPHLVPAMSRATIKLRLKLPAEESSGFAALRLTQPESNAIMFALAPALAPAKSEATATGNTQPPHARRSAIKPSHQLDLTSDLESTRRHLFGYEPVYFAVGSRERLNARFQFSFRYRAFEPAPAGAPWPEQLVRDVYAAYTQTSIWDLEAFSKPFYDSSYKPTIFLLHEFHSFPPRNGLLSLQAGIQHESNGKGGGAVLTSSGGGSAQRNAPDSRSVNSLYFAPKVRWTADNDLFFELGTRVSAYFQIDENPDLARYRGHVDLTLRGGYDRGFQLSAYLRGDPRAHGSVEFNATWPSIETPLLKFILPASLGGYTQIQYFNGYGESLLDYNVRRKDQLRFGLTIVR